MSNWIIPTIQAGVQVVKHRNEIQNLWDRFLNLFAPKTRIAVTGMPGVGKTVLFDYIKEKSNYVVEIQQLLNTANSIKNEIEKNKQLKEKYLLIAGFISMTFFFLRQLIDDIESSDYYNYYLITIILIFFSILIYLYFLDREIDKNLKKDKQDLNKIVDVIQDIIPYYYEHMNVLEKANIEAQLSRLHIVDITKDKQNKNQT